MKYLVWNGPLVGALVVGSLGLTLFTLANCSSDSAKPAASPSGTSTSKPHQGDNPPPHRSQKCDPAGSTESSCGDGLDNDCDGFTDCADEDCDGMSCALGGLVCEDQACGAGSVFSPLPSLDGLTYEVRSDSAVFAFLPRDDARDYRIWALPADPSTIDQRDDGTLLVPGAVYRCAGERPLKPREEHLGGDIFSYARSDDEALLGHAYSQAGPGRLPVFALGHPGPDSDDRLGSDVNSTRTMTYTTDEELRTKLLADGHRDDGVAFYAPESGETQVHGFVSVPQEFPAGQVFRLYYAAESEKKVRDGQDGEHQAAFQLLAEPASGTLPVYRVSTGSDDLLALGAGLLNRYLTQGNQPVSQLAWSGLTEETTLVLEALDRGCPFEGHYAATDTKAEGYAEPFLSLPRLMSETDDEITINGQFSPGEPPRVVARSLVTIAPEAPPEMDFYADFLTSGIDQTYSEVARDNGLKWLRLESELFDVEFYSIEFPSWSLGTALGQLWVGYADWAADTNGKFRMTAKEMAQLKSSEFVHVTAEMDIPSTHRRYPQILISDLAAPVQSRLEEGVTLIVQPFASMTYVQTQLCNKRLWDVNNQCPTFQIGRTRDFNLAFEDNETPWQPKPVAGEVSGFDLQVKFDVYLSTQRVYVFMNDRPYGCGNFDEGTWPEGPVSVTLGDVLYHSGVDEQIVCADCTHRYLKEFRLAQTIRRFDSFGFSSGVGSPIWNEALMPCSDELN